MWKRQHARSRLEVPCESCSLLSLSNSTSFVRAVPFGPRIRRHSPSICDPSPDLLMQQAVRSSRCLLATERILMLVACAAGRQPGRSLPPHAWFIKGCDPQSACGVAEIRGFALAQSNRDSIFFFFACKFKHPGLGLSAAGQCQARAVLAATQAGRGRTKDFKAGSHGGLLLGSWVTDTGHAGGSTPVRRRLPETERKTVGI